MGFPNDHNVVVRYRGFLLLQQPNRTWLVRPERSPMLLLPFRTPSCSLAEVKKVLERKIKTTEAKKEWDNKRIESSRERSNSIQNIETEEI